MSLQLSPYDEAVLAGRYGEAARLAMAIVVRMAAISGASELMDISQAHIDGCIYQGPASLEFAETFANLDGRVAVATTLNIGAVDEHGWQAYPVAAEYAERSLRIMHAYQRLGCQPTWTCAPYQAGVRPAVGEQIAWAESNAIVFANSVLGARTARYPDYFDLCAALTGRVPKADLHLAENRRGQDLYRLGTLPYSLRRADSFYPVLGYYLGERTGERIPVLAGLPAETTEDDLKALGAAAASSGRLALFHAVGITPEAPTLAAACAGGEPERVVDVHLADLRAVRDRMSLRQIEETDEVLDAVVLGCPHFSPAEFRRLAALVADRDRHPQVEVVVTTSRFVRDMVRARPEWAQLERFGVKIVVDTCILHMPSLRPGARTLMTNSGKLAHYVPGMLGVGVAFGSLAECVESAVRGKIARGEAPWND